MFGRNKVIVAKGVSEQGEKGIKIEIKIPVLLAEKERRFYNGTELGAGAQERYETIAKMLANYLTENSLIGLFAEGNDVLLNSLKEATARMKIFVGAEEEKRCGSKT